MDNPFLRISLQTVGTPQVAFVYLPGANVKGKRPRPHGRLLFGRLEDHPSPYVSTSQLARYWNVSEKEIYKTLRAGRLAAIRLGPRLLRISKATALAFMTEPAYTNTPANALKTERVSKNDRRRR